MPRNAFTPEHRRTAQNRNPASSTRKTEMPNGQDYGRAINLDECPELLNISEVGEILRTSRHMVYRLIENGTLAHIHIGPRCNRVYRESVRRLILEKSSR